MLVRRTATLVAVLGGGLAVPAGADFTVDLGSGSLAGGQTRVVEVIVDESMIPPGQVMLGFEFSMDFVANGSSWSSDCGFWIEDSDGNPTVQYGGYNVLFADQQGPWWPFMNGQAVNSGTYTAAFDFLRTGNGLWRFGIGNAWSTSGPAQYDNVTVTVVVGFSGPCGASSIDCGQPHDTPGCSDPYCCSNVCAEVPDCCDIAWDEFCVAAAVEICGIYQYDCPAGGPPNNCPTNATVIAVGETLPFDTINADPVGPESDCEWDNSLGRDVWFQHCADANGSLIFSSCNQTDYDQKMRAYDIGDGNYDPNDLPELLMACADDSCGVSGGASTVTIQVEAGRCYLLGVGGYGESAGTGTVSLEFIPELACGDPDAGDCCQPSAQSLPFCNDGSCCEAVCAVDPTCCEASWDGGCAIAAFQVCAKACPEPGNDECDGALVMTDGANAFNTFNATTSELQPPVKGCTLFGSNLVKNDRWYVYSPSCDGTVTMSLCPEDGGYATFDTKLAVWTGSDCGDLTIVGCDDDSCASSSRVEFAATCGANYYIQVGAWSSSGLGVGELAISCEGGSSCGNPADLDGDGTVGGADLAIMLSAWGDCVACASCSADLDGDCVVGGADLALLLGAWGD